MKRDAPYFEAAFHSRLAGNLAAEGFPIERTAKGWEVAGIPESALSKFSRRTAEIEALAKEKGITSAKQKDKLGANTRERKREDVSRSELRELWAMRLTPEERQALSRVAVGAGTGSPAVTVRESLDFSLLHAFERASVVPEKTLMATALRHGVGSVRPEEIKREVRREDVISKEFEGQRLSTTRPVLAEEGHMLDFCRSGRGTCRPLVPGRYEFTRDFLSAAQKDAVRHVLSSYDRVIAIRGAAGTGKTTLMQEAAEAIKAAGKDVFVFAPSAEASRGVLRKEGFAGAETVAKLLQDEKLQDRIKGGVVWVDEAGLLGTRQLGQVFDLAARQGARVILSGDSRQHGSVERGDALRLLESQAGLPIARVTEIQRQKDGGYKAAVEALSRGNTLTGLERLDAIGFVREIADDTRHKALAADYLEAVGSGRSALAIAPTRREGAMVSDAIREGLRAKGRIGQADRPFDQLTNYSLTEAQRGDALSYRPGDQAVFTQNAKGFKRGERVTVLGRDKTGSVQVRRESGAASSLPLGQPGRFQVYESGTLGLAAGDVLRITQNGYTADKRHRLNNGSVHEVKGFTEGGDILLKNGWVVAADFGHLAHGYCQTSVSSQGKTVDRVLIAQDSESGRAASQEQFYVSASRAKERVTVYTDDKEALFSAVQRSSTRMAATELVFSPPKPVTEPARRNRLQEHAELVNRLASLARAYASQKINDSLDGMGKMIRERMAERGKEDRGMGYER